MQQHQNIFDNEIFFEGYRQLREREDNYNVLLEQPAMEKLLPNLKGKTVLDLGCGYGHNCIEFIKKGASKVVGIDISEKMLNVANDENSNKNIEYVNMSMTDIDKLEDKFDFIYSSLAFHYIEDFESFCKLMYSKLNNKGYLLFSQEHPIVTASTGMGLGYNKDENGVRTSYTFTNYGLPGERKCFWYVDGVKKYHRRFSDITNSLCKAGFIIEEVCEPTPDENAVKFLPQIKLKEKIKHTFLIVKAHR